MKKINVLFIALICSMMGNAQNVGVGISAPVEKLDIDGALKIGTTTGTHAGTIRWNPDRNDFEGYNGDGWVSLTGSQGTWGQQDIFSCENSGSTFTLYNNDPEFGGKLGWSMDADDGFIYAGAYDAYVLGNPGAGSLRIISKEQQGWVEFATYSYSSPVPVANEFFGFSVDRSSSFLMVGAPGWSSQRGRAFIYSVNNGGELTLNSTLTLPDMAPNDFFGGTVSMTNDYAFASAIYKDVSGVNNVGRVSVFKRNINTNVFALNGNIISPDGVQDDNFGKALSVSGSYLAIGVPRKVGNGMIYKGRVYMYALSGNTWVHMQSIDAPDAAEYDEFGGCVFLSGDTLFVGATQLNSPLIAHQGKVYYYLRNGQEWVLQGILLATDGSWRSAYGNSISMKDQTLIIGAPRAKRGFHNGAGKAYVYHFISGDWVQQTILTASNPELNSQFGEAVVVASQSVIVAAPSAQVNEVPDNGRLYYFYK